MYGRRKPFGLLSEVELSVIDRILNEKGIVGASRGMYYAFVSAMKGKKVRTREDLDEVIRRGVEKGAQEDALRRIASIVRPDLS
jgi:hypothetical protein